MKRGPITLMMLGVFVFAASAGRGAAQTLNASVMPGPSALPDAPVALNQAAAVDSGGFTNSMDGNVAVPPDAQPYHRPSQRTQLHNYFFEAFGPYPIVAAAFTAGVNQLSDSPPEWQQGLKGYGRRFGSNMGIVTTTTTSRFLLSEAFDEDNRYYRCSCTGFLPRLGHAMIATLTARRGDDGHHVFSVPALVAPYVGTETAIHAWYPNRYGAKDAFRMGNYVLLGYMGQNISIEFITFDRGKSLLTKFHLNNRRAAPVPDSPPTTAPGPGQ